MVVGGRRTGTTQSSISVSSLVAGLAAESQSKFLQNKNDDGTLSKTHNGPPVAVTTKSRISAAQSAAFARSLALAVGAAGVVLSAFSSESDKPLSRLLQG